MSFRVSSVCHRYVVTMGVFQVTQHLQNSHLCNSWLLSRRTVLILDVHYLCMPMYYQTWRKQPCHYISICLRGLLSVGTIHSIKWHHPSHTSWWVCLWSASTAWFIIKKINQTNTRSIKRPSLMSRLFINGPYFDLLPFKFYANHIISDSLTGHRHSGTAESEETEKLSSHSNGIWVIWEFGIEQCYEETDTHNRETIKSLISRPIKAPIWPEDLNAAVKTFIHKQYNFNSIQHKTTCPYTLVTMARLFSLQTNRENGCLFAGGSLLSAPPPDL